MNQKGYIKHLITCKCILAHLRQLPNAPFHKFIVFSEVSEDGGMVPSLAQCPNCGVVHKVMETETSQVLRKEDLASLLSVKEIKADLPDSLVETLALYNLELHQWQEIKWIMENEAWGKGAILVKDKADGLVTGKAIQILGVSLWRITSFTSEDVAEVSR